MIKFGADLILCNLVYSLVIIIFSLSFIVDSYGVKSTVLCTAKFNQISRPMYLRENHTENN